MSKDENVKQISLRQQPFAAAEKVHDVVAETYKLLKKSVTVVQRSMALYLANRDTEMILFKPIKVGSGFITEVSYSLDKIRAQDKKGYLIIIRDNFD